MMESLSVLSPELVPLHQRLVTMRRQFAALAARENPSKTELQKLVDELRTFAPLAQRTAKKLLNDTEDSTLTVAIELEGHCYSRLRQSDDFKEGVEAFNAKRPPRFVGR